MFHVSKYAYSFATSSVPELMTPTNEEVEVLQPLAIVQGVDKIAEDYYRDSMAFFEVEDVFFRVPKCLFEPGPGKFEPLLLDEDVISLPDLTADEFRALIDFFLPYRCLNRGEHSLNHWINLLSISTKYQLDLIRPIAIRGVDMYKPEIDPVEKNALGTKYGIKEWEASSFEILCQHPEPLTDEEAEKLGAVLVAKIFRNREIRFRSDMASGQTAGTLRPFVGLTNPPRDPTAVPDPVPGPPGVSQSDAVPTTPGVTNVKPVANSTNATPTTPDDTTIRSTSPKVKLEPLEDQNVFANPQPAPSLPNNGPSIDIGNPLPSAPRSLSPPVSGKTPQNSGPSSPTPTTSQSQGHAFFNGVSTSDPPFTVKLAEAQKPPGESALPATASQSKFTFKQ